MRRNKYRVVRDSYSGFEAQIKFWWWPFWWFQVNGVNTRATLEASKAVCEGHKQRKAVLWSD